MVLFSDIGCPWAHAAVHRWHETRSGWHNPGVDMHWEGEAGTGFPVVDKDDPSAYEEMFDRVTSPAA